MTKLNKAVEEFISEHLENASVLHLNELDYEKLDIKRILYEDLGKHDLFGYYPIGSEYVDENYVPTSIEKGKLCFYLAKNQHEMYLGTTGSGKTTGCVIPQLRCISSGKKKPHIFITDPKGEIFKTNALHLQKQGYMIRLLNFKDSTKTNLWNPLGEIYDIYVKKHDIGKGVKEASGPIDEHYELFNEGVSTFSLDKYYLYENFAFANKDDLNDYLDALRNDCFVEAEDLILQFAGMIIQVQSTKDRSWEEGAQRLLRGILFFMLEETKTSNDQTGMTRKCFTLKTVNQLYLKMRDEIFRDTDNDRAPGDILSCPSFQHKTAKDYSIQLMRPITDNAQNTTRSYFGVFDTSTQKWLNGKIANLTLDDTMDISFTSKAPMAIFLITRDYEKTDFLVAGLFIDWLYRKAVEAYENGITNHELHFLLDEFGNIPGIRHFENKIATSRSRNIWFHLILQSYAQLHGVYDEMLNGSASIIKDNCNSQIFLGTQNFATKEEFSKQCGMKTYLNFRSSADEKKDFITSNVLPISQLDLIKPGQMYLKRLATPVILTHYVRSYQCKEFAVDYNINGYTITKDIIKAKTINPSSKIYTFSREKKLRLDDFSDFDVFK